MTDTAFTKVIEEQTFSYLELCTHYEKTPSVLGFAEHLAEEYGDL